MKEKLILFGATGDLAKAKILPALAALGIEPLLYGRKENFVPNYIQGELDQIYEKLNDIYITHAYVALPPMYYAQVLKELARLPQVPRIALEKPFGTSYDDAQSLAALIQELKLEDKVYLVDHYLGKPALVEHMRLSSEERMTEFNPHRMSRVYIDAFESQTVAHRGMFYDGVGTIKDFVQNHIMAIVSTFLMQGTCDTATTQCRTQVLEKLSYVEGSVRIAQYDGYLDTEGVQKDSRTETYVECEFNYGGIVEIYIRAGKALRVSSVDVTISYQVGHSKKIAVQSTHNSYEDILKDFISDASMYRLSTKEALLCWKVTSDLLIDKERQQMNTYPQGSDPDKFMFRQIGI